MRTSKRYQLYEGDAPCDSTGDDVEMGGAMAKFGCSDLPLLGGCSKLCVHFEESSCKKNCSI